MSEPRFLKSFYFKNDHGAVVSRPLENSHIKHFTHHRGGPQSRAIIKLTFLKMLLEGNRCMLLDVGV